jgi:DNA-binding NarL/FixJ family response regulator
MANKVKFSSEQEMYILDLYQQGYTVNSIAIEMGAAFDTAKNS